MFNKKKGKRILSMLLVICMVMSLYFTGWKKEVSAENTSSEVILAESEEANYEKLTFSDLGVADGAILNKTSTGHTNYGTFEGDLDEIYFQGKIKFPSVADAETFGNIYIGAGDWYGISIVPYKGGVIQVSVISNGCTVENQTIGNLPASVRNNPTQTFGISVKYENENSATGTTDLKIGIWFDHVLYNNDYLVVKNVQTSDLIRRIHTYDTTTDAKANVLVASVYDKDLENSEEAAYELLTFKDFGVDDGDILNRTTTGHDVYSTLSGNLNEVIFRGNYYFPSVENGKQFGNIYLGKANWWAIALSADSAGNLMVSVPGATIAYEGSANLSSGLTGIAIRENENLEIAISIKYLSEDTTAKTANLKIGVWFNGELANGSYIYANGVKTDDLIRCFHTYDDKANTSVKVSSYRVRLEDSEEANYEKLTFSDLGVEDGVILNDANGEHKDYGTFEGDLNEIYFQGKIKFPAESASKTYGQIYIGEGKWFGLSIVPYSSGVIQVSVISTGHTVVNQTVGNLPSTVRNNATQVFGLSVKYVSEDIVNGTADLKIGIWLDHELLGGKYLYVNNVKTSDLIRRIHTLDQDATANGNVYVASVYDKSLAQSEEANYERLTFFDFGIDDGKILNKTTTGHDIYDTLDGDLDEVLFEGKFKFPSQTVSKQFGNIYLGKANWWAIALSTDSTGNLMLSIPGATLDYDAAANLSSGLTGTPIRENDDLVIGISIKYENTDVASGKTDLKIGVWFNGELANGSYIYANGVDISNLTRCFHTYDVDANSSVTVASVRENQVVRLSESEEAGYENLTFSDFGVQDGEILTEKNGTKTTYGTLEGDLDEVLFQAKYVFPTLDESKQFGNIYLGRPDWYGIALTQDSSGNIIIQTISDGCQITNPIATNFTKYYPTQLRGNQELELAFSIKYENVDEVAGTTDLKLGVWINGVLHERGYIYVKNAKLTDLIRCVHTYDVDENSSVKIASTNAKPVQTLPTDFENITLTDGSIPDGNTVTYGKFYRLESLNRTIFSANVRFNEAGARLHLGTPGGGADAYSGMGIRLESNGTLVLGNELAPTEGVQKNELTSIGLNFLVIQPKAAGMGDTFAEKEFLLQVSTEFVDKDGDELENDIKVGVFINGVLYCNTYVYIMNQADVLGTGVNVNGVNKENFAEFSSVILDEITLEDLGISDGTYKKPVASKNSKESLDQTAVTMNLMFNKAGKSAVSLGANGAGVVFTQVSADTVNLSYKDDETVVDVAQLKLPVAKAFELRTTYEFIKAGDGKTNLKLGVFVDGKLYNYKYFVIHDVDEEVLNREIGIIPQGAEIAVASNSYEELTLRDYIVKDKKLDVYGGRFYFYEGETYDNTEFSANLKFEKEDAKKSSNCIYLGGEGWFGLRMIIEATDQLVLSHVHADGTQVILARIQPSDVGLKSFYGTEFEYRVTFDVIEQAKQQFSYVAGVYVNEHLCNDKPLVINHVDEKVLNRGLFTYIGKNGGSITMKSTRPEVDFSIFGFTKNWKKILGI